MDRSASCKRKWDHFTFTAHDLIDLITLTAILPRFSRNRLDSGIKEIKMMETIMRNVENIAIAFKLKLPMA